MAATPLFSLTKHFHKTQWFPPSFQGERPGATVPNRAVGRPGQRMHSTNYILAGIAPLSLCRLERQNPFLKAYRHRTGKLPPMGYGHRGQEILHRCECAFQHSLLKFLLLGVREWYAHYKYQDSAL